MTPKIRIKFILKMNLLGKDLVGNVLGYLSPTDWYCLSLVNKEWWTILRKWLQTRKIIFYKRLRELEKLLCISLKEDKNILCLRPIYFLSPLGTGCQGAITNYCCVKHRENSDICVKCNKEPVSDYCFGNYCDNIDCRDYMLVLRDGEAVKVRKYPCRMKDCNGFTDVFSGSCYTHATREFYLQKHEKGTANKTEKVKCRAMTKKGKQCEKIITTRIGKCHIHLTGAVAFL